MRSFDTDSATRTSRELGALDPLRRRRGTRSKRFSGQSAPFIEPAEAGATESK